MSRIQNLFQQKQNNVLNIYCTAGYPTLNSTMEVMEALQAKGADLIELGIPYSDPLADGPIIQESGGIALQNGMTIKILIAQLQQMRKTIHLPVILMGYINPVLKFGMDNFCRKCAETGIDGVILPDLPPELYSEHYSGIFEGSGLYNILLISPQTDNERIRMIDNISRGFVYLVSSSSTTGMRRSFSEDQVAYFRRIKEMNLQNPLYVLFSQS